MLHPAEYKDTQYSIDEENEHEESKYIDERGEREHDGLDQCLETLILI